MKKLSIVVIIVLSLVFALSSCDLWYGIFGDPIVGTWVLTAETIDGTVFTIGTGASDVSTTLIAAKEGTITGSGTFFGSPFTTTGTWTKSETTYALVTTGSIGGTSTSTSTLSSDGKTMTATITGSGITSGSMTMAKQ
jgi:hypothetical protein